MRQLHFLRLHPWREETLELRFGSFFVRERSPFVYFLLYPFASEFGAFNVFRYITFRTGAATLTALFIAFMVGPPLIRALERLRVGQPIRDIGPCCASA